MTGREPFAVKLHRWLLRALQPVLGRDFVLQASSTFGDLYNDCRTAPLRQRARLWGREIGALVSTVFSELRGSGAGEGMRASTTVPQPPGGERRSQHRILSALDNLARDLRYAVRNLVRSPLFVAVSVSSVALSVAAATAVFSVVNAGLLRQDPYVHRPDELIRIFGSHRDHPYGPLSYLDVMDIRQQAGTLEDVAAYRTSRITLTREGYGSRQVHTEQVSDNWFTMLGIPITLGRGFVPEDADPGTLVAVLGYGMWDREFESDPNVIGSSIRLNGRMHTVVGVAPRGLLAHEDPTQPELWTLIPEHIREERGRTGLKAVGRMRDGVAIAQVRSELDLVAERLVQEYPDNWSDQSGENRGLRVLTDRAGRLPPDQRAENVAVLLVLAMVVTLILLIACSNVANLLLTRAWRRRTEIAVRLSLGAGRTRLVGQLLTEGVLLGLVAGGVGLIATHWLTTALANGALFVPLPTAIDLTVDWRVATFALGLALVTGVVFSLVPALHASKPNLVPALKGLESGGRLRRSTTRNILVVVQVAASMILVFSSALLLRSLHEARSVDIGFNPENVAMVGLDLSHRDYGTEEAAQFYNDLLERLRGLPGVDDAVLGNRVPLEGGSSLWGGLKPEGYELGPREYLTINYNTVSPGYFDLIDVPMLRGRDFNETDRAGEQQVAIVNQAFVDRFWPAQNAVGKHVIARDEYRIVGVVADAKYVTVSEGRTPHIWVPAAQSKSVAYRVHVRTSGDPRALLPIIREEVHAMDRDLPIVESRLMRSLTDRAVLPYRVISVVLTAAGLIALGLAMMGVYGVMAYAVSQRTREVGIRIAVGARQESVVRMIVREGLALAAVGAVIALPLMVLLAQLLKTFLVGVRPLDPLSLLSGITLLAAAAFAATLFPALRAARVDPMLALRAE